MNRAEARNNPARGVVLREHRPIMTFDPPRIFGCACGWRAPLGVADSDDAMAVHVAVAMVTA